MSKINDVMTLAAGGGLYDAALVPFLNASGAHIAATKAALNGAGYTSLASQLNAAQTSPTFATLATHVASTDILDRLTTFGSVKSIRDTLGNPLGADDLSGAFGALFCARTFVRSLDVINSTLGALPNLKTAKTAAQAALTALNPGSACAPTGDVATATAVLDEATAAVAGAEATITGRVTEIAAMTGHIPGLIAAEDAFYVASAATIENFTNAVQVTNLFDDAQTRAVLGAVGSDTLLSILRSPD